MVQKPTHFCSECGTPVATGERFCSNCGSATVDNFNAPTIGAANPSPTTVQAAQQFPTAEATLRNTNPPGAQANTNAAPYATTNQDQTPPPPPPTSGAYNPYTVNAPGGPQAYAQSTTAPDYAAPTPGVDNPIPPYAQAKKGHGCLTISIVLLLILAIGIGGTLFFRGNFFHSPANSSTSSPSSPTASNGTTVSTTGVRTAQLSLKVTFASIQMTIVSVQTARSFADDPSTSNLASDAARLNLHEVNNSPDNPRYLEEDVLLLILPDGTSIKSINQQQGISPDAGVSRDNWIDFALNHPVRLDQLTLRIGTPSQHQMDIPLRANANLSRYLDRTSSPNLQFQYNTVNWTLKSATLSYSYHDKQATAGNLYVFINFALINHTSSDVSIFPNDFMRLQAGSSTQAPDSNTFPYTIAAQGTAEGVAGFLVPQNATSFTLILLGNTSVNPPIAQVTQTFQIQ